MSHQSINRFLGACGAVGPLKLIAEPIEKKSAGDNELRVTLEQPFALIGSGVRSDLRLDDDQVSHRHLYLQVYDGRVFAFDLGSRTGTRWDEERRPHGWLNGEQAVRVGRYRIHLDGETVLQKSTEDLPEPLVSRAFQNPLLPPVSLEFVKGSESSKPARCPLHRVLVFLGRTDGCKVRLMHDSVSKFHCCLVRTPRGVWVVDLLSRNGVWANGTKVPWARLEEGDRFEVGNFELRLRYDRPDEEDDRTRPSPASTPEGERDRGSKIEDGGSKIAKERQSFFDPRSSILDPRSSPDPRSSVVDVPSSGQDVERDRHTLVVSSRRAPVPAELSESIALIISNQFAEMQRQMFDQFQQAMMVMFQTFSLLHRDQMELVRQELNRVHELTRQLHELQAELAKQPGAAKDPDVQRLLHDAQKTAATPEADLSAAFNPDDWNEAFLKAAQKVMAAKLPEDQDSGRDKAEEAKPISVSPSEAPDFLATESVSTSLPSESFPSRAKKEDQAGDQSAEVSRAAAAASSSEAPSQAGADIHALLCQKIAALQAERQGRWQKIIQFLAGKQSSAPLP
jgi:pSer/pThr/pTyr-binding forkhead associated (FHA) protein